jgi:outer membrane lipoprotein
MRRYIHCGGILSLLLCFLSCVTPTAYQIWKDQLDEDIPFSQIIQQPERHKGKMAYWGGTIISTLNTEVGTQIEVLQKPLDNNKKPKKTDQSAGRFIIMHPGYLDAAVYAPRRDIVVVGKISGTITKPAGEAEYNYPLIVAKEIQLIEP